MRSLTGGLARALARAWNDGRGATDPAPSRIAYRATRLWLSPLFRVAATIVVPVAALVFLAGWYLAQPAQQRLMRGWSADLRATIAARPEFQIQQMEVAGASRDLTDEIHRRVGVTFPVSWFALDTELIEDRITALDAVASVRVAVDLGGAMRIAVTEREPAILWRQGPILQILDGEGHRIAYLDRREGRSDLPLVTGTGADTAVPEALALIALSEPLRDRLRGLTRRGERRWDIVLTRDQRILLPETGASAALERVLAMDQATDLLDRDVPIVDLRDPDRPTIRLGVHATEYLRLARDFERTLNTQ